VKGKIVKEKSTVSSHGNVDDLLKNVPFELNKYVIEIMSSFIPGTEINYFFPVADWATDF
jgi:hypothetical protein